MLLNVSDISFSYKGHPVLDSVSFSIDKGSAVSVLGRNGSGKTTLMRLLLGFLKPQSGRILADGIDIAELPGRKRAEIMAYIPQHSEITYPFTVLETAVMGAAPRIGTFSRPGKKEYGRAEENLRLLGIEDLRDRSVSKISGGELQLTLIARALTQNAKLLLLDEPANALDYSNQLLVLEKIEELRRSGYSVLFSTHNPEHALMIASEVLVLRSGKSFCYSPEELKDGTVLSDLYGRDLFITELDTGKNRRTVCLPK